MGLAVLAGLLAPRAAPAQVPVFGASSPVVSNVPRYAKPDRRSVQVSAKSMASNTSGANTGWRAR